MAVLLITPLENNLAALVAALEAARLDHYEMQAQAGVLVAFRGTTQELSNRVGITGPTAQAGELGAAIVTRMDGYYGVGSTHMWEWIESRRAHGPQSGRD